MAFFDDLGKKISSTSQSMMQKGKGQVDILKLKSQISDEEKKISKNYSVLGQLYYHAEVENPLPELKAVVDEIKAAYAHIEELREAITAIENANKCSNCGAQIDDDMVFCTSCGKKIERNTESEQAQAEPEVRFCVNCGKQIPADALFCMNCGTKQE